ncbi:YggS family pyridoxal phosphate-dependent enzyme, partial [Alphaproteobacteria bacterium]|nr:YggS family pyridoxal phosphate-dependent enzyme [Alphaproteobacteria bacterium]
MPFNYTKYQEVQGYIDKKSLYSAKIIAVSKNHPKTSVEEAILNGVTIFGENRVQEALEKFTSIKKNNSTIELHLTGPLQTNKVKTALSIFDIFQTLDREKLALQFNKYPELLKNKLFFIQVNTGKEKTKSGLFPEHTDEFVKFCKFDLNISIVGLMCIPPKNEQPKDHFNLLANIAKRNTLQHLSMGMSDDYKSAVLSGATFVRIGT